jgi:hypothetical protein
MDFYVAAIKCHLLRRIPRAGNRCQQLLPDASFAPPGKAVVNRLVWPILGRTIFPATTDPLHMHDPAQYSTVVISLRPRLVGRQMRLDFRPLLIAEPKQARIHGWPPNPLTNLLNQHTVN